MIKNIKLCLYTKKLIVKELQHKQYESVKKNAIIELNTADQEKTKQYEHKCSRRLRNMCVKMCDNHKLNGAND